MSKNPFNSKAPESRGAGPMSSLSVQSYHQDSPPFTGQANDETIPAMDLNSNRESASGDTAEDKAEYATDRSPRSSNRSSPNSSASSEFQNHLKGKAAFSPMYSPRPDGSTQPSPNPMLSDLPSSAANAIASRAVRPSIQRESSEVGVARDRVPKEPRIAPEFDQKQDYEEDAAKAPITPNPFGDQFKRKDFSPPDLTDGADMFGDDGYVFPKHKLKGMMEGECGALCSL